MIDHFSPGVNEFSNVVKSVVPPNFRAISSINAFSPSAPSLLTGKAATRDHRP